MGPLRHDTEIKDSFIHTYMMSSSLLLGGGGPLVAGDCKGLCVSQTVGGFQGHSIRPE